MPTALARAAGKHLDDAVGIEAHQATEPAFANHGAIAAIDVGPRAVSNAEAQRAVPSAPLARAVQAGVNQANRFSRPSAGTPARPKSGTTTTTIQRSCKIVHKAEKQCNRWRRTRRRSS